MHPYLRFSVSLRAMAVCAALAACADTSLKPITAPVSEGMDAGERAPDPCADLPAQSCSCDDAGLGFRYCSAGSYGACVSCRAPNPEAATINKCVPGYYEGWGRGMHHSSAAGIPGLIAGDATSSNALWHFVLNQKGVDEFSEVGSACIHLMEADAGVDNGDYRIELTGDVNCSTGQLIGVIRGYYVANSVLSWVDKQRFYYKGELTATFDPATQTFVDGTWYILEPKVAIGDTPRGDGTWSATLDPDAGLPPEESNCLGAAFPESEFN